MVNTGFTQTPHQSDADSCLSGVRQNSMKHASGESIVSFLTNLLHETAKGFRLSKRGLALSRMFFAGVGIFDYIMFLGGLDFFMAADGLARTEDAVEHDIVPSVFVYAANQGNFYVVALLIFAICLNVLWFIGAPGSRIFSPLIWYLRWACYMKTQIWDGPLFCAMVWHAYLIFLPCDEQWSIQSLYRRERKSTTEAWSATKEKCEKDTVNNVVTFCYVMHLWVMYLTVAWVKVGMVPSFVTGEELWYTLLNNIEGRRNLNMVLLQYVPNIVFVIACRATIALEFMGPLLSIWKIRTVTVLSFLAFHCGISMLMDVGSFFCVMFGILLPLVPSEHLIAADAVVEYVVGVFAKVCIIPCGISVHNRNYGILGKICAIVSSLYSLHMFFAAMVVNCEWLASEHVRNYTINGTEHFAVSQEFWSTMFKSPVETVFPDSNEYISSWKRNKYFGVYNYPHTAKRFNMFSRPEVKSIWYSQIGVLDNGHAFPLRIGQYFSQQWAQHNEILPEKFDNSTSAQNATHLRYLLYDDGTQYHKSDFFSSPYMIYWTQIRSSKSKLLHAGSWICDRHAMANNKAAPSLSYVLFFEIHHDLSEPGNFSYREGGRAYWFHFCKGRHPPMEAYHTLRSLHSIGIENTDIKNYGFAHHPLTEEPWVAELLLAEVKQLISEREGKDEVCDEAQNRSVS